MSEGGVEMSPGTERPVGPRRTAGLMLFSRHFLDFFWIMILYVFSRVISIGGITRLENLYLGLSRNAFAWPKSEIFRHSRALIVLARNKVEQKARRDYKNLRGSVQRWLHHAMHR